MGMVGSCGATPPASKKITRLGAVVRWASIAAAHGTPVPTATVRPSSRRRAAQQIINSIALYGRPMSRLRPSASAMQQQLLLPKLLQPGQAAAALEVLGKVRHAEE